MKNCIGCGILLDYGDWWVVDEICNDVCCTDCWENNGFKKQVQASENRDRLFDEDMTGQDSEAYYDGLY